MKGKRQRPVSSYPYHNLNEGEEAEASLLAPTYTPTPLEDHSPPVRQHEASLRQPRTILLCLQPHGCLPSPPAIQYATQMFPTL